MESFVFEKKVLLLEWTSNLGGPRGQNQVLDEIYS